jgi:hypothetical protein
MPVINKVSFTAPINVEQCYLLLQEVGATIDKCPLIGSNSKDFLLWKKDNGLWFKPVMLKADLMFIEPSKTEVTLSAEIHGMAIVDPARLTIKTIELFERPFKQSISAWLGSQSTGANIPPLIKDIEANSVADEIRKLAELKEEGIISEDEFINQKKNLLKN